jgi:hypothetical protein
VKVVTIATDLENVFLTRLLVPSCAAVGLELTILHPAASASSAFTPSDKRAIMTGYLAGLHDRDELVVFTDAYDALFIRGEAYIESAYAAFGERIVFSAEPNSWPLGAIGFTLHAAPPADRFPYLNSGGYIGPAADLLDFYVRYPAPPTDRFEVLTRLRAHGYDPDRRFGWSDQYHWTLIQHLEPAAIGLDHDAALFECYAAPNPDINLREMLRDAEGFREQGTDSPVYQQEHARLKASFDVASAAAHVHFASAVTKTVAMDMYDQGRWPDWLTSALGTGPSTSTEHVRIHEI